MRIEREISMPISSRSSKSSLRRLLENLKSQQRLIYAAVTCSILNKLFDLAPPVLIGLSVDVVVREQSSWLARFGLITVPTQLAFLAIASFLIWSAESLFEYLYGVLWRNLAQSAQHNLRLKAYKHLQKLEMAFFEAGNTGRIMTVLNDDINQLERFLDHGANQILQLSTTVLFVGGAMAFVAPGIALFSFIPIPLILWGSVYFQKLLSPRYREVRERAGDLSARLSNNLGGILTIKSFVTESWELERMRIDSHAYRQSNKNAIKLSAAFIPLIRFAILFAFLAILILGGLQAWQGSLGVGTYSFLVFITQRLLWPLTTLGNTLDEYQRSMASTNRVLDLIDTPISIYGGQIRVSPKDIRGEISFENVNFNYKDRDLLLEDFSLKIKAGTTVGIVGATGSGKSTLVKLLLRLYSINSGKILLDSVPIDSLDLADLRRCFSLVPQEVYLFCGTVSENIAYGNKDLPNSAIVNAAELSESIEFIDSLPQGFNTIVGERGQRLSGGQRQRIALARAIIKEAPVLILDEATAAVDNETEAAIQRSLSRLRVNRTTIVIAHRLSTVRSADSIIVMDQGRIVEQGKHEDLISNSGPYYDLWRVQAGLIS